MWVKAPLPLQSPSAQTCGLEVRSASSTDVAALVGRYAGSVQAEIVGIVHPPDGKQQLRAVLAGGSRLAVEADGKPLGLLLHADALRVEP